MDTTRYDGFFRLIEENYDPERVRTLRDAFAVAAAALDGMTRYDGTPLLDHSVGTAAIVVSEIGLGRSSAIATLLHDAVRMGLIDLDTVEKNYGVEIAGILRGMNLISKVKTKDSLNQADNFRELIISYSTDPRVILIKLADRLEVMRSLDMFPDAKRRKKSWESMNLYAPIAHKLGLYSIKSELEDLALRWLEPDDYNHIKTKLEETSAERDKFIAGFIVPIEEKLRRQGIKYHIKGRTKSIYSIWGKMKRTGVPFEEVFDIFAIRIIVDCPREAEKQVCWNVYSIVTDFYTPNPNRMRDWISIPKSNGYESLHTTVVTKEGNWVEIQIRSERMDEVAEKGIAAHWRYKGVHGSGQSHEEWLARLRETMDESDRRDIGSGKAVPVPAPASGEIFVFTPNGDLRKLPEGATVLDFAFDIHTGVGSTCTGARIGERNVPIKETLRNGDIVHITTSKNQKPKADWLNIAVTNKARGRIKAFLREEQMKMAKLGREELERKLKNWKLAITIDEAVSALCKYYKVKTGTELYARIADGRIDVGDIKELIVRHIDGELFESKLPPKQPLAPHHKQEERDNDDALIIGDSVGGLDHKPGKCCNPIFGDEVFGFITISSGVTIHRTDCPNARRLREQYPYRVIEARWRSTARQGSFVASIRIVAEDTTGMVNRITDMITNHLKINIRSMSLSPIRDNRIGGLINVEVSNTQMLDMIAFHLLKIKGVEKAHRVTS